MDKQLFEKYDVQVPRYTSYPPIPSWRDDLTGPMWTQHLGQALGNDETSWSLYIHLPFCETQCSFCACNNVITSNHSHEDQYLAAVHKEWAAYTQLVPALKSRKIRQLHLGGGSPTFFSAQNLRRLLTPIMNDLVINPTQFEGAIEIDPRRCTLEQLQTLKDFGFNRLSMGVQDFDPDVQEYVRRVQPFEMVQKAVENGRSLGFPSINFDLIYGLPGQTERSIKDTAEKTVLLRPDRIALYSLAVVPWLKPAQNRFKKMELCQGYKKRRLFEIARKVFLKAGYIELGIDHFALPSDAIALSNANKSVHRNFMGYTEYATDVLLGLGVSAISETPTSFHQNVKDLPSYYQAVEQAQGLPTFRGHVLSPEDQEYRRYILELMTDFQTTFKDGAIDQGSFSEMLGEGLVRFDRNKLEITPNGKPFCRHVCLLVDRYSHKTIQQQRYSSGV